MRGQATKAAGNSVKSGPLDGFGRGFPGDPVGAVKAGLQETPVAQIVFLRFQPPFIES
jgi:hypothetical protein